MLPCRETHNHEFYINETDSELEQHLQNVTYYADYYENLKVREVYRYMATVVQCEIQKRKELWEGLYGTYMHEHQST